MVEVLILLLLVVLIVVSTAWWKINPFLALLGAGILGGFLYRIPTAEIIPTITGAFGTTLGGIGLVIVFGTMIGVILEKSGAAISMADAMIRVLGDRFPNLTMSLIGYVVSIPVFCDSGYVILNSLRKAITVRAGVSALGTATALMTGLFATHSLVPPTPGPLAAAENLGVTEHLGTFIGYGLIVALVAAMAVLPWASWLSKRHFTPVPLPEGEEDITEDYEKLRASYGQLPSAGAAFAPILVPILLIALGSVSKLPSAPFGEGTLAAVIGFIGTPVIALMVGLLFAVGLLRGKGKLETFNEQTGEALRVAAPILLITGAGAAFGGILQASPLIEVLETSLGNLGIGLAVPFLIAAALKTAQGSSTVAIVTASTMVAPLLDSLGLGTTDGAVLAAIATGAGAMVVSHANDSFFWVVSQLSRIPVATAYRSLTVATLIQGVVAFLAVYGLSLVVL